MWNGLIGFWDPERQELACLFAPGTQWPAENDGGQLPVLHAIVVSREGAAGERCEALYPVFRRGALDTLGSDGPLPFNINFPPGTDEFILRTYRISPVSGEIQALNPDGALVFSSALGQEGSILPPVFWPETSGPRTSLVLGFDVNSADKITLIEDAQVPVPKEGARALFLLPAAEMDGSCTYGPARLLQPRITILRAQAGENADRHVLLPLPVTELAGLSRCLPEPAIQLIHHNSEVATAALHQRQMAEADVSGTLYDAPYRQEAAIPQYEDIARWTYHLGRLPFGQPISLEGRAANVGDLLWARVDSGRSLGRFVGGQANSDGAVVFLRVSHDEWQGFDPSARAGTAVAQAPDWLSSTLRARVRDAIARDIVPIRDRFEADHPCPWEKAARSGIHITLEEMAELVPSPASMWVTDGIAGALSLELSSFLPRHSSLAAAIACGPAFLSDKTFVTALGAAYRAHPHGSPAMLFYIAHAWASRLSPDNRAVLARALDKDIALQAAYLHALLLPSDARDETAGRRATGILEAAFLTHDPREGPQAFAIEYLRQRELRDVLARYPNLRALLFREIDDANLSADEARAIASIRATEFPRDVGRDPRASAAIVSPELALRSYDFIGKALESLCARISLVLEVLDRHEPLDNDKLGSQLEYVRSEDIADLVSSPPARLGSWFRELVPEPADGQLIVQADGGSVTRPAVAALLMVEALSASRDSLRDYIDRARRDFAQRVPAQLPGHQLTDQPMLDAIASGLWMATRQSPAGASERKVAMNCLKSELRSASLSEGSGRLLGQLVLALRRDLDPGVFLGNTETAHRRAAISLLRAADPAAFVKEICRESQKAA